MLVERTQQIELRYLLRVGHVGAAIKIVDRRALRVERGALKHAGQKSSTPVLRVSLGQSAAQRVVHHDEAGQVAVLAAQSVADPCAHAREAHAAEARVDFEQRRRVVVGFGKARVNERHAVDVFAHLRKNFRNPRTRLPALLELEGRPHQRAHLLGEEARVLVEAFQLLAIALGQFGFVVPGVDLALTAVHEQPDDAFGLGRKVRGFGRHGIDRQRRGSVGRVCQQPLRLQHGGQRQQAGSGSGPGQELAARRVGRRRLCEKLGSIHDASPR